ncbi:MAG: TatD family hydrolase [Bacilli bacterium]|nr:TatD family hydrolase [Bacilli bacterium]
MFIDTHCHIKKEDIEEINKMGKNIMILGGSDPASNIENLKLKKDNIFITLGLHPECADTYKEEDIKFIEDNIDKICAIGEIGLDYYYTKDNIEKQKELFIKQLELAKKYNKTVVIHSRDSIMDTYNILKEYKEIPKIIHCYSGSIEMAKQFISINSMLGIGGVVTFKNAKTLQKVVENIPLDYLVLETDSPYLAPEPLRGTKNEPYNVTYIAKKIAELKNIDVNEVYRITTNNAIKQFNIN